MFYFHFFSNQVASNKIQGQAIPLACPCKIEHKKRHNFLSLLLCHSSRRGLFIPQSHKMAFFLVIHFVWGQLGLLKDVTPDTNARTKYSQSIDIRNVTIYMDFICPYRYKKVITKKETRKNKNQWPKPDPHRRLGECAKTCCLEHHRAELSVFASPVKTLKLHRRIFPPIKIHPRNFRRASFDRYLQKQITQMPIRTWKSIYVLHNE